MAASLNVLCSVAFGLLVSNLLLRDASAMPMLPGCAANVTKSPSVCCPVPSGRKNPCGFPTRGVCRPVQTFKEPLVNRNFAYQFQNDPRVHWPHRVFQYSCECLQRYWGPDCSECWFGYEGPNCQHRVVYKRKRASTLTTQEKKYFRDVMNKAYSLPSRYVLPTGMPKKKRISGPFKNSTVIESLVYFHWYAGHEFQTKNKTLCHKTPIAKHMDFCHGQPNFPFFHRLYTLVWEREMQKIGRQYFSHGNWTWPYWDWTDAKKCDICTDDFVGEETGPYHPKSGGNRLSPKSVFHKWEAVCSHLYMDKCAGCFGSPEKVFVTRKWIANNFPTSDDVRRALRVPRLYNTSSLCHSFTHILESGQKCFCDPDDVRLHRRVHLMMNGTMIRAEASPADPIFFLHHVNIDRLYTRWHQRVHPSKFEIPSYNSFWLGGCRECAIVSVIPPVTNEDMMVDPIALGFEYEDLEFGAVKATEEIASGFNTFVPPVEKGCPQSKKS